MIRASLILRVLAPLAVAFSVGGTAATADAAPFKKMCSAGVCFHKDDQGYVDDKTRFYLTFNGSAVTHYNVRYREEGGREVQGELRTFQNSNKSQTGAIFGKPGKRYYVSIQACTRVKVNVGPFSVGTKSQCTSWGQISFIAV